MNNILIARVFNLSLKFLSLPQLFKLLLLNKEISQRIQNQRFKRKAVYKIMQQKDKKADNHDILNRYFILTNIYCVDFQEAYQSIKSSFNRLKNPYGKFGFQYWKRIDGGYGWNIQNTQTFDGKSTIFVGSYGLGELRQEFQYFSQHPGLLIVGAYVGNSFGVTSFVSFIVKCNEKTYETYVRSSINNFRYQNLKIMINIEANISYQILCQFRARTQEFGVKDGTRFGNLYAEIYKKNNRHL